MKKHLHGTIAKKNMLNEDRINELNNIMNGNFVEVSLAQYVKKKYALLYPQQKNVNKMKNSTNKQAIREREDETIVLQTSSITIFQHEIDLL